MVKARWLWAIVVGALVASLAACNGGGSARTPSTALSETGPPSASASLSLSPTPTPSPTLSEADTAAIEQVVRDYLDAFIDPDAGRNYRGRKSNSTGDLKTWATWLQLLPAFSEAERPDMKVNTLSVAGFDGDTATVELDVRAAYSDGSKYQITGPALVQRVGGEWKLLDYKRDGRDQVDAIFTKPKGSVDTGNVTLKVVGVVLQDDYTSVFVKITNHSSTKVSLYDASLVDAHGRQLSGGVIGDGFADVVAHASLSTGLRWDAQSLPLKTEQFRIIGSIVPASGNPVDYDFTVHLGG